jgi:hypothetical protein
MLIVYYYFNVYHMFVTPQVRGRDILAQLTMNLSLVTNVVVVVCARARVGGCYFSSNSSKGVKYANYFRTICK